MQATSTKRIRALAQPVPKEPQIVVIASQKGGSGKTSLIMMLASAASARGLRVHIIDGDRNPQLSEWRGKMEAFEWSEGMQSPEWPENITTEKMVGDLDEVEAQVHKQSGKSHLVLIDTRPGNYADTEDVIYLGDAVLIPAALEPAEVEWTRRTFAWVYNLRRSFPDAKTHPAIKICLNKLSKSAIQAFDKGDTDRLTEVEFAMAQLLAELPMLNTPIPDSKVVENISITGPLAAIASAQPHRRHASNQVLSLAEKLLLEVLKLERK
jgi:chromosome partitioning protein